ncbi:MAG: hypothetical protein QS748_06005 [Candidatus Endonucleobacter bathymodioli]|uniref:Uncharacterized protein n=1 Tax=Candidatus Endonucleibacter bathymodioli TaxID=539814 RepID=A0AA90NT08_9GAMM|nr:hypothetical protein [Candidatus Endonucleobacter bathymodioli]
MPMPITVGDIVSGALIMVGCPCSGASATPEILFNKYRVDINNHDGFLALLVALNEELNNFKQDALNIVASPMVGLYKKDTFFSISSMVELQLKPCVPFFISRGF